MSELRPVSGPLAELTEKEFSEFVWYLGRIAFNSVPAAAFARHRHPIDTLKDYMSVLPGDDRPTALAKEYFRDLAAYGTTEELSRKWFGKSPQELAGDAAKLLDRDVERKG